MQVRPVQQVKFLRSSNNVESQLHFELKLREAFTAKTIRKTVLTNSRRKSKVELKTTRTSKANNFALKSKNITNLYYH